MTENVTEVIDSSHSITINAIGVRESILRFAVAMEEEMRKKDSKYNETHRSDIDFLIDHLKEEREEVDSDIHCIYIPKTVHPKFLIDVKDHAKIELVHEAIMCMLVRDAIKV